MKGDLMSLQRVTPCLWFDTQAEEAVSFYTGIFSASKIIQTVYNPEGGPSPAGTVLTIFFELDGQQYMALNAGPRYKFTEAISLMVNCKTQQEIDYYWDKLTGSGGSEVECGWVKDQFGLFWQIIPESLPELLSNPATSGKVLHAVWSMKKIDLATLEAAARP